MFLSGLEIPVAPQADADMIVTMNPETVRPNAPKNVFITGASRGLGFAVAEVFFQNGANLALTCRKQTERLVPFLDQKKEGQIVSIHAADLAEPADVRRLEDEAIFSHGEFDAAVLCAGVTLSKLIARTTEDEFDEMVRINLTSTAQLCRVLYEPLKKRQGHLVLVGTFPALTGKTGLAAYAVSKAGVIGLARTLAKEYAPEVRVNVILPGYMPTDMGRSVSEKTIESARGENLLGALSDPYEVAGFIRHLCSMRGVSAQVFNLDSRPLPFA